MRHLNDCGPVQVLANRGRGDPHSKRASAVQSAQQVLDLKSVQGAR